ncbi:hypothetical protein RI129_008519 [Pyrocoelia pectoralis]|uniref:Mos1 transposase HTH domain-containing protein n=1 Tax=Pyrocoelia pectoralis TaxID=417401 RepID=A0AAN7ZHH5_9COLE
MAIKFCVKLEKSAAETIPMLKKAFGVDCLSDRQIFRWHKAFAEGREDVNVCAKLMPKVLPDDQKACRVETCQELLDTCEENPTFLDDVITGDESWVFEYDPETKRQIILL